MLLLFFFATGLMPLMAQITTAPRETPRPEGYTQRHSSATMPIRSLTSGATVSMGCTDQVGFTLGTPGTTTDWGYTCPDTYTVGAEFYNGTYYLSTYPGGYIIAYDPTTNTATTITTSSDANAIAYNPADGQMYGYNLEGHVLYTVDMSTGTTTQVVAVNTTNTILALTITNDGRFLMVDPVEDAICELDPTTGDLTILITANFDVNYIQDITMDRETNTPYWAAYNADDEEAQLYSIDLANNNLALIGAFDDEVAGFATATYSGADALRPAAPTNFAAVPAADHTLSAELSWTNPTVDLGGNALTSLTSIELYRNGTLLNSFANPTVGGTMNYTDNTIPADGTYTYSVYGVNANGNGGAAAVTANVGNLCDITIEMTDSWGDGWNGAAIEIVDGNNVTIGSYTCNGANTTTNVPLPVGSYTFNWVVGSYDSECSFTITNSFGIPLYQSSGTPSAGAFLTYNNTCNPPAYYTVSGNVTVSATNAPVANATVAINGLNGDIVTTDANGYYEKDSIVEGFAYSLMVNADGYNTTSTSFSGIYADTTINFALTAPGLEVTYAAPIDVTTTQGLSAQYSPITVSNTGDGNLAWGTGVEFVRGREATNAPATYTMEVSDRERVLSSSDVCPTDATIVGEPTRNAWDLISTINASSAGQQGIATDGNFIYTCSWLSTPTAGHTFMKYDLEGNLIDGFDIAGVSGCRDLTYDGTYFYVGTSSSSLYQLDFANQTLVSTINTQVSAIRHCSYDPENDGFWVGNWTDLYLIDRSGNIVTTGPAIQSAYGSAYDNYSAGGPYLWLFTQAYGNNGQAVFIQYDIHNNALTNTTVDLSSNTPGIASDGLAGGAFATDALVSGKFVMMANVQQEPNLIGIYELADAGWLSVTPGSGRIAAGGQSTDITLNFDGNNPIGDYYANLTITSNNPFVGDTIIPITYHIIAPDCDAPNNLQVVPTDYTYMALSWEAPANTTDFVEYRLYKNGNVHEFATTTETTYNDTVAPGEYCYIVKAYYTDGTNQCLSLPSDTICEEMLHEPSLTVTPTNMHFTTPAGNASGAQTAAVLAYTLESDIDVTTNAPFEVSVDGTTYGTTATITLTGNETNATLYVRLGASAAVGVYTDTVVLTSDNLSASIIVNGEAIDCSTAATLPFTEDFEGGVFPPTCWRLLSTNSITWTSNISEEDNSTWAYCNYADDFQDEQLITKTIDFTGGVQTVLTFDFIASNTYVLSSDPDEQYNLVIYASTDGGNTFASTPLYSMRDDQPSFSDWTLTRSNEIDLSSLIGQTNVQLMFQYIGTYGAEMWIDNIRIDEPSAIDETDAETIIRVFPNPASNMINVEAQGFEKYQLVNMLGQTVKSDKLVNGRTQVNVSNLSNGVYFVRLINGNSVETIKVVKR